MVVAVAFVAAAVVVVVVVVVAVIVVVGVAAVVVNIFAAIFAAVVVAELASLALGLGVVARVGMEACLKVWSLLLHIAKAVYFDDFLYFLEV